MFSLLMPYQVFLDIKNGLAPAIAKKKIILAIKKGNEYQTKIDGEIYNIEVDENGDLTLVL